ncbi:MAG: hypothetical protein R3F11_08240 [Verrucomicrobiales bacterium]
MNEEVVHGIGSDRVIQDGDIVKIDVGGQNPARMDRRQCDDRPGCEISPAVERLLYATEESLDAAVECAQSGAYLGELLRSSKIVWPTAIPWCATWSPRRRAKAARTAAGAELPER